MTAKIILSGFGGQGIIASGKLLAYAAMKEDKNVTHYPSYGAEMRGGTCSCSVIISDRQISSPVIGVADYVLAFNKPSLNKYQKIMKPGGTMILNSTLILDPLDRKDIKSVSLAASDLAEKHNNLRGTNMAMIGAFIKVTGIVSLDAVINSMKDAFPSMKDPVIETNILTLKEGYNAV